MAFKPITNSRGAIIRGKNGKAELIWNAGCAPRMNEMLSKKQEIIDSEVLRLCAPMVPKRTGALERSGTLGTVIGSGEGYKYVHDYPGHFVRQEYRPLEASGFPYYVPSQQGYENEVRSLRKTRGFEDPPKD